MQMSTRMNMTTKLQRIQKMRTSPNNEDPEYGYKSCIKKILKIIDFVGEEKIASFLFQTNFQLFVSDRFSNVCCPCITFKAACNSSRQLVLPTLLRSTRFGLDCLDQQYHRNMNSYAWCLRKKYSLENLIWNINY